MKDRNKGHRFQKMSFSFTATPISDPDFAPTHIPSLGTHNHSQWCVQWQASGTLEPGPPI